MIFHIFKDFFGDGWTVYGHESSGAGGDILWVGVFVGLIYCLGSMFTLGIDTVISIILVMITLVARIMVNTKNQSTIFTLWIHPITLCFFKYAGSSGYAAFKEGRMAPFIGAIVLFFMIFLVSSLDYEYNGVTAMYAAITLIITVIYVNYQYPNGFVLTPVKLALYMYIVATVATFVKRLFSTKNSK